MADTATNIPIDATGRIAGDGTTAKTYHVDTTDGTWQAISLPEGVECKTILLQMHGTSETEYDPDTACSPFLFSNTDATGWVVIPAYGLQLNVVKTSGVIGKIKAASGDHVSILVID